MKQLVAARLTNGGNAIELEWEDGVRREILGLWLKDNLTENRDAHSGQRLIDVADLPACPRMTATSLIKEDLRIDWDGDLRSTHPTFWLTRALRGGPPPEQVPHLWADGSSLDAHRDFAWLKFADLSQPGERLAWLTRVAREGVGFLSEVPRVADGILQAMQKVGRVAETNYGLVFDVRAVPQPENLAYSDRGLGLHTDNPYREPVPGFQALHTLQAAPDGGDSLFADGWALATYLRTESPEDFKVLSSTPVPFHYRAAQAELYAERPLISLDCEGGIRAVHYNSRSIAPLRLEGKACARFYAAYRRFAALLREERFQLKFRLRDGELVLFDNQRILHGRTGFASANYPRHLRGCYLTRDSVFSEIGVLRRGAEGPA